MPPLLPLCLGVSVLKEVAVQPVHNGKSVGTLELRDTEAQRKRRKKGGGVAV